jgi:hypothetical protein
VGLNLKIQLKGISLVNFEAGEIYVPAVAEEADSSDSRVFTNAGSPSGNWFESSLCMMVYVFTLSLCLLAGRGLSKVENEAGGKCAEVWFSELELINERFSSMQTVPRIAIEIYRVRSQQQVSAERLYRLLHRVCCHFNSREVFTWA